MLGLQVLFNAVVELVLLLLEDLQARGGLRGWQGGLLGLAGGDAPPRAVIVCTASERFSRSSPVTAGIGSTSTMSFRVSCGFVF